MEMKKLLLILIILSLYHTETSPIVFNLSKPILLNHTTLKVPKSEIYTIYAYCPCSICCGKETSITASGTNATKSRTVASDLPFGTKVYIEGIGKRIVEDRGVTGKVIDVFVSEHNEALKFGFKRMKVKIMNR